MPVQSSSHAPVPDSPATVARKVFACVISAAIALALIPVVPAAPASAASTYVASVNGKSYKSLKDAFNAAPKGSTITMLANCETGHIDVEKSCTLDLNGRTVTKTGAGAFYSNYAFWLEKSDVSFTIKDSAGNGKLKSEALLVCLNTKNTSFTLESGTLYSEWINATRGAISIEKANCKVTLNGGTVECPNACVLAFYKGDAKNSTITINGGTCTTNGEHWNALDPSVIRYICGTYSAGTNNNVVINGGTLKANGGSVFSCHGIPTVPSGSVTVNGGVLESAQQDTELRNTSQEKKISFSVNGGYFKHQPQSGLIASDRVVTQTRSGAYAGWYHVIPKEITVTYDANGGKLTSSSTRSVGFGKTVSKPTDPTRDGYRFEGWTLEKNGSEIFDFSTPVKDYTTLYAKWTSYVAQIGQTPYVSLKAAVDAAKSGDTVTLYGDVSLDGEGEGSVSVSGKIVTIDLAGHTVSTAKETQAFRVSDKGTLTVKDSASTGKITSDYYGIEVQEGSSFTLESGSIEAGIYAIYNSSSSSAGGTVFIAGGSLRGKTAITSETHTAAIEVDEGTLTGAKYVIDNQSTATVEVYGGRFVNTVSSTTAPSILSSEGRVAVSGGTFDRAVPQNQCADGFSPCELGTNPQTYSVKPDNASSLNAAALSPTKDPGNAIARIGDTEYTSLQDAADAVAAGQAIVLADDVTLDEPVVFAGKSFTLDLAGHTISAACDTFGAALFIDGGIAVIDDSSDDKTGAISVTEGDFASAVAVVDFDSFELKAGKLTCAESSALYLSSTDGDSSKAVISGGEVSGFVCAVDIYKQVAFTVTGGSFNGGLGSVTALYDTASFDISGGSFNAGAAVEIINDDAPSGFISGGTFASEVPLDQCAKGYIPVTLDEQAGTYSVAKGWVVSFDAGDGTLAQGTRTQYVKDGDKVAEPEAPTASKDGYELAGWFTKRGTEWNFKSSTASATTTLYAKYQPIEYKITYNLDGGTNGAGNPSSYTIDDEGITLAAPTKSGCNFVGWFADPVEKPEQQPEGALGTQVTDIDHGSTGDIELKAVWTDKPIYVLDFQNCAKYYDNLKDAFAAAGQGDAVTLVADTSSSETATLSGKKDVTLNLNGHSAKSSADVAVKVEQGATLGVADSGKGSLSGAVNAVKVDQASLTVTGGTLTVDKAGATIEASGSGSAGKTDTFVNINGGVVDGAAGTGIHLATNGIAFHMDEGTVTGDKAVVNDGASNTLAIDGGTLKGASAPDITTAAGTPGFVYGGTFAHAVPAAQLAEGYVLVANADGTYSISIPEATAPAKKKAAKTITINVKTVTAKKVKAAAKKAGATKTSLKSITLGKKVKTIKKGAFKGYSKLKTLTVKTKKLTKKSVKNALKGSKVKTVKVKVGSKKTNKKYVKTYKKIFTKKVVGKKVAVK